LSDSETSRISASPQASDEGLVEGATVRIRFQPIDWTQRHKDGPPADRHNFYSPEMVEEFDGLIGRVVIVDRSEIPYGIRFFTEEVVFSPMAWFHADDVERVSDGES
jgi:hypothetical protein